MSTRAPSPEPRALERPQPTAPRPYHFPKFEKRVLPNGLRLVIAPVHKLPVVSIVAVVAAGAITDPVGQEGLASLTAHAMTEGTTSLDAVELTRRVERLGTAVDAAADWDAAAVSMTVLTPKLAEAFALFADVVRAPAFPEREIERMKAERIAEILHLRAEPRGLADEAFARAVYPTGSRFAASEGGDERTVGALRREDVERFHASRYVPGATTIVVAGDITPDAAEALVAGAFGDWKGAPPLVPNVDDRAGVSDRRVVLVAKPGAAQSEMRVGHVGVPRLTPDYFATTVMNGILGGLFSSRINLNLREEHAYTYWAHSAFDWRVAAGPFEVSSAVQSDVTSAAIAEVLKEIDRIRAEPVLETELSLATSYLDGVFPIRYETTGAIASALANLVVFGLPDDYFDTYRDRVRAVTTDEILAAARAHLHPDALQIVVVGDPSIRESLESLGVAVTVVDAEGKPA